jgi:FkbM family methyltransferase
MLEKNNFKDRLFYLIKEHSRYEFPESKTDFVPNFDMPVKIEANRFQLKKIQRETIDHLHRDYDLAGLENTYGLFCDEYSKEMFLNVMLYRLFDKSRFRLPLYYSQVWKFFDRIDTLSVPGSGFKLNDWDFHLYDLKEIGFEVKLFYFKIGIFINYLLEQYRYKNKVYVRQGDYVIDGGSCYGDTALYFANAAGRSGKVFSFEFIEENLEIFKKNIDMNPAIKDIVELTERPLYSDSVSEFSAVGNGPGAALTEARHGRTYKTISIDDFIGRSKIEKINYIKLDIEGSEMDALRGARETITRFRPQLAICLYHKNTDFSTIPKLLKEFVPEYELFLDQFTIMNWETVLFAKAAI